MEYRDRLVSAIKATHGVASALHIRTVPVKEVFGGETVFDGLVSVFVISGHKKAAYCYAWGFQEKPGDWNITTVLELPPVSSAESAIKVAVAAHAREVTAQQSRKP
jgi:hypothetical protein